MINADVLFSQLVISMVCVAAGHNNYWKDREAIYDMNYIRFL